MHEPYVSMSKNSKNKRLTLKPSKLIVYINLNVTPEPTFQNRGSTNVFW